MRRGSLALARAGMRDVGCDESTPHRNISKRVDEIIVAFLPLRLGSFQSNNNNTTTGV